MRDVKQKAEEIFNGMSLEDQRLTTYFAAKMSQSSLEYLEQKLKEKAVTQKYCRDEGLNYEEVVCGRFLQEASVLCQKCEKLKESNRWVKKIFSEISLIFTKKN